MLRDTELTCHSQGSSSQPVLVLLHGFLGRGADWAPVTRLLSQQFYCLAPDLPLSEPVPEPESVSDTVTVPMPEPEPDKHSALAQASRSLSRWLSQLGITDYHLLGYSMGGRVAMYHSCFSHHRPRSLITEGAHPGLTDNTARQQRWQHDRLWARRFAEQPLLQTLEQWYRQPVFASLTAEQRQWVINYRLSLFSDQLATVPRQLAATLLGYSLARQPDLRQPLGDTRLPTACCYGGLDSKFAALSQQLADHIPQLDLLCLPQCGHNCHQQQPELFSETISQWLTRQNS